MPVFSICYARRLQQAPAEHIEADEMTTSTPPQQAGLNHSGEAFVVLPCRANYV
jgi:hypothetical protein